MSRKKSTPQPGALKSFTVFEQGKLLEKRGRGGETSYEANLIRVGEIQATHAGAALDMAKKNGMANYPMIWGEETEAKREVNKKRKQYDEENKDDRKRRYD